LEGHCWQVAPPLPQPASVLPGKQNMPSQQPAQLPHEEEEPVQLPLTQELPPLHWTQRLAPLPHADATSPFWQNPLPSQQPLQLERLHWLLVLTQTPDAQTWLPLQGGLQLPSSGASSSGYTQAARRRLVAMASGSPWFLKAIGASPTIPSRLKNRAVR
jgi:hypothetical protein